VVLYSTLIRGNPSASKTLRQDAAPTAKDAKNQRVDFFLEIGGENREGCPVPPSMW
jgi:hypothetical protein